MNSGPYESVRTRGVQQGFIYRFRPVPWLSPPVWILDHVNWSGRRATLRSINLDDAFRDASKNNQEYIVTEAKLRFVIVLHLASERARSASVIPVYSLREHRNPSFVAAIRNARLPDKFFLPADAGFGIRDSYADLSRIQPMDAEFLTEKAKVGKLSSVVRRALLVQYGHCLAGH